MAALVAAIATLDGDGLVPGDYRPQTLLGAYRNAATARERGYGAGRFSFNVKGGRCEACEGDGVIKVEMHFLPTVYVQCDVCDGKRFTKETLEVKYKHKTIHEVLEMTIEEAYSFFYEIPAIADRLKTLNEVGLGYLKLGQSATTLSGGEAQRVKISSELYRPHVERTIYLLDEPTVGLHYEDVRKLIEILQELVRRGNTVVVIEHNLDVIKSADYLIDFGPEGGTGGGGHAPRRRRHSGHALSLFAIGSAPEDQALPAEASGLPRRQHRGAGRRFATAGFPVGTQAR